MVERDIFKEVYNSKKNEKQNEEYLKGTEKLKEKGKLGFYLEKQKRKIDKYFSSLKFYDYIDSKYEHCNMDISTELTDEKEKCLNELYKYYEKRKESLKKDWESQIKKAKYKAVCQTQGELKCNNGHELNSGPIKCNECDGTLYWVDGETHYCICIGCQEISKCESCICSLCKASTKCVPKFTNYRP